VVPFFDRSPNLSHWEFRHGHIALCLRGRCEPNFRPRNRCRPVRSLSSFLLLAGAKDRAFSLVFGSLDSLVRSIFPPRSSTASSLRVDAYLDFPSSNVGPPLLFFWRYSLKLDDRFPRGSELVCLDWSQHARFGFPFDHPIDVGMVFPPHGLMSTAANASKCDSSSVPEARFFCSEPHFAFFLPLNLVRQV